MRILYFSRSYAIHDHRFLSALGNSGHEIHYLCLERDPILLETRPLPSNVALVSWRGGTKSRLTIEDRLGLMPDLQKVLGSVRPDVVHAGPVPTCGFMVALAGFRPLLVMSWGSDLLVQADHDSAWRWMTCYALNHSDMLIGDCNAVALKAQQLVNYSEDRIVQFPWGVDLTVFTSHLTDSSLRRLLGWEDAFVILSTRSWESDYGITFLLEAFYAAQLREPRLRLLLLGNGSLRDRILAFIRDSHLESRVHIAGQVPESQLSGYFQAADMFVSCAYSDGTSISLLEAMATSLPVIVTDNESNREWITGGCGGLLVAYADADGLREALLHIASMSPESRRHWGRHNRHIVEERADWKKNFSLLLNAYERVQSIVQSEKKS
jgi:L-malate glycosyltransferase